MSQDIYARQEHVQGDNALRDNPINAPVDELNSKLVRGATRQNNKPSYTLSGQ